MEGDDNKKVEVNRVEIAKNWKALKSAFLLSKTNIILKASCFNCINISSNNFYKIR